MFGTIRKHQTWLWAIIITITVISFVIFFSPYQRMSNAGGRGNVDYGWYNNQRITEDDFDHAQREISLGFFLRAGRFLRWPNDEEAKKMGFDPMLETYKRIVLIQKQDQLGIQTSKELVKQYAWQIARSLERSGVTSPKMLVDQVLKPVGLTAEDFERFLRHDLAIQELVGTFGMPGKLMTPEEAKGLYEREHQELATEAVFFSASNYLATVSNTPEAITQFYQNNSNYYRIPDQVQVRYAKFAVSNYLGQAQDELQTNITELIDQNYQRLGTNAFPEAKTPEEAKAKIREELFRTKGMSYAVTNAVNFARQLFVMEPVSGDNLEALAKTNSIAQTNGAIVGITAPFDKEEGPKDLQVGNDFIKAAFALTQDEPFPSQAVAGKDGVYVIAFYKKIPARIPPLDEIRDKVTEDYKYNEAVRMARNAGIQFYQTLTLGMSQGKTFTAVCEEAKLKSITPPPFSISTREVPGIEDHISLNGQNGLKEIAFSTPVGKVSRFYPTREGGVILEVKSALPIDQAKEKAELPDFMANVRQTRQNEAFFEWFRQQLQGLRGTPLNAPPPAAPGTSTAKS
jgi:hypothetical protein